MGSDHAPEPEIRGAILACRAFPVRVHLIGPKDKLSAGLGVLGRRVPIEIVHTDEWITMDDKAAKAVREKRNSTMRLGLRMVKERSAAGFVTAGNTGAAMASAKMVLGALPGVDRPALAMPLPTTTGSPCVLLDVGANVDCKVQNLAQFAIMGEMYARSVLLIQKPRVGLLSIGEEETKGNELTREALQVLKQLPIRFIGNVEGRDLYNGHADVIVCDGFVGNVALSRMLASELTSFPQRSPPHHQLPRSQPLLEYMARQVSSVSLFQEQPRSVELSLATVLMCATMTSARLKVETSCNRKASSN
jgi:glycerol-3-phosphate acyltransferase PlsX